MVVLGRMQGWFLDCGVSSIFICQGECRNREVLENPGNRSDAFETEFMWAEADMSSEKMSTDSVGL